MPDPDTDVALGATVYDTSSGRYGTVVDTQMSQSRVYLRPIGGGLEWTASREDLRPATTGDLLAERMREGRPR